MKTSRFCIFLLMFFIAYQPNITVFAKCEYMPLTCEERLNLLEPSNTKTFYDQELLRDRDIDTFKEKVLPIPLVNKKGSKIHFETVYKDLNWQRPAYDPTWHSSNWRWSYVPTNMAFQQHIVFDYNGGASWWYDLSHFLALPKDVEQPSPIHESAFTVNYPYVLRLIIFKFDVKSIKYYKSQIVVLGEPLRKGLTIVDFDTKNLPDNKKLLQLATQDGYELDYLTL